MTQKYNDLKEKYDNDISKYHNTPQNQQEIEYLDDSEQTTDTTNKEQSILN